MTPDGAEPQVPAVPPWILGVGALGGLTMAWVAVFRLDGPQRDLVICVSLAIVLALFGTTAEVKRRWWIITGAGATAVVLFWVLQAAGHSKCSVITRGIIRTKHGGFLKTDARSPEVLVKDLEYLPGVMDADYQQFRFVVDQSDLRASFIKIYISEPNVALAEFSVQKTALASYVASRDLIELEYDRESQCLTDTKTQKEVACFRRPGVSPAVAVGSAPFSFVRSAFAAEPPCAGDAPSLVNALFARGDLRAQVEARECLVNREEAIALLVERVSSGKETDRYDALYVLAASLPQDAGYADATRKAFTPSALRAVVGMLGGDNRGARRLAMTFLMDLRDTSSVAPLIEAVRTGHNDECRYNAALVLESMVDVLSESESNAVRAAVASAATRDRSPVRTSMLRAFGEKRFYVVARTVDDMPEGITLAQGLRGSGFPDATVEQLESGAFAVSLGRYRLPEAGAVKTKAVGDGVAGRDAWITPGTSFTKTVFPPTA